MAYDATKYLPVAAGSKGDKGDTGTDGNQADQGTWVTATGYSANDRVYHAYTGFGQSVFRCKITHTSGAGTEPTVGASWATYWELWAKGGADGVGTGDVVGPASSTSDYLAGFADATGKLIKSLGSFASCLSTALSALTASTTDTDGDVDAIAVKESGGWKLKTADNFAQRYIPVTITAQAWQPSSTSGCGDAANAEMATNKANFRSLPFGYASKSYACFKMKFPIGYDGGTLYAYFEWHSTGTTSNGVRWGIATASIGDNETLDASWGTAVEVTDNATGTAYRNLITAKTAAITPAGTPASGETLEIRIYRDPAHGDDNLNEIVYLDDVTLLIPVNKHSEA